MILSALVAFAPQAQATVTATSIYSLGYPVALAEDQSGNIYIGDDHNANSSKQGLVVIPSSTGTLFGQAVTAGTPLTLIQRANIAGIAVTSSNAIVYSFSNGDVYALSGSGTTLFGISVAANTETLIASGTGLRGGLDFDSAGNLFGVHIATGNVYVLPASTTTLFGTSVTANTSALLYSNGSNWFWDLAVDSTGNIFVADGWGLQGVFVMPKNTGTIYGQSVTANTFVKLTGFGTTRYAGIDVGPNDVLFANIYANQTRAVSPTTGTIFQVAMTANTVATVTGTSGYVNQGLLATANGDLISGAYSATFRLVATPTLTAPGAPTIGVATATSPTSATVTFTAPGSNGGATIETYTATSTPGSITGRVSQSGSGTITVSGLSPSTSYTFRVTASNSVGTSSASSATVSITTPSSEAELAAARNAAEAAARKAREDALAKARAALLELIRRGAPLTLNDVNSAEFGVITDKSLPLIGNDFTQRLRNRPIELEEVQKVIFTHSVVEKIARKESRLYAGDLVSIGLIEGNERSKSSIVRALSKLSGESLDSYQELQGEIAQVQKFHEDRQNRLREVASRIRNR